MSSETVSLLPCPFCGSTDLSDQGPSYTQIMCNGCGAHEYDQPSREEAIAAWNLRSKPVASGVEGVDRLGDCERNKIINQASTDLESIINGHDPDISIIANDVWDRLDKMAVAIERRILSALLPKATAPGVSEPVAWQHTFELPDGHKESEVNTCPQHPFGCAGRDYSNDAVITSAPLYASPQPQPKAVTEEMVERAMASIEGEPDLFITKGALRYALEAAMKEA